MNDTGGVRTRLQIEQRRLADLKPFAKNARQHSAQQIEQLAASMKEFGWTIPLLIKPDGEVIAGHGRVLAAQALGLENVPVIIADHLSAAQCRAYVLADNQLALNATWDNLTLAEEITGLKLEGFDLNLVGFSDADLALLFPAETLDANGQWRGMPEFKNEKTSFHDIILHFKDAAALAAFAKLIEQDIDNTTRSIWYPEHERIIDANKQYIAE